MYWNSGSGLGGIAGMKPGIRVLGFWWNWLEPRSGAGIEACLLPSPHLRVISSLLLPILAPSFSDLLLLPSPEPIFVSDLLLRSPSPRHAPLRPSAAFSAPLSGHLRAPLRLSAPLRAPTRPSAPLSGPLRAPLRPSAALSAPLSLLHCDFLPARLSDFLADSRFAFVGVGVDEDAERLADECGLTVADPVDLRDLAAERTGRRELKQMGLAGLAAEVMGVQVWKNDRVRMSRWDRRDLTLDQIGYAAVDAFLSFEIGRMLFAGEF